MKKRLPIIIALCSIFLLPTFSQHTPENWTTILETAEVRFEKQGEQCVDADLATDQGRQFLRITNLSDQVIKISWLNALFYDGECLTCENINEYTYTLTLEPKATESGTCNGLYPFLNLFERDNKGVIASRLTDIKIYQLTTTLINRN